MSPLNLFSTSKRMLAVIVTLFIFSGCQKFDWFNHHGNDNNHLSQTKDYTSDVALKWIDMQLHLSATNPTPVGGVPPQRYYAYTAIALYESVVQGMPDYRTLSGQLTDMPAMPQVKKGFSYNWPTCANAALAAMSRDFFTAATPANLTSMDSLENALYSGYPDISAEELQRSVEFGKAVAQLVFDWSKADGVANANAPYTVPVGPGLWVPTPPALSAPFGPYWGNNRLMVTGSLSGSDQPAPPTYSTDPSSDYYKMVKEVYDVSQSLTDEQKAIGLYYRDNPGFGGGHYISILNQILQKEQPRLDFTAMAFAEVTIGIVDAGIGCFKTKYDPIYNQERPITYIRNIMGHPEWNTLFPTPNFPDFPSAHSTIAGSFEEILTCLFGANYHFTDHSYDYLGMPPQTYTSFTDLAIQIGKSRVYAGIHNTYSCTAGREQGRKIGKNILAKIRFKK